MKKPSRKMTASVVGYIKDLLATGQYHQHQIAAIVNVNPGRVSETKHGKWDWTLNTDDGQKSLF